MLNLVAKHLNPTEIGSLRESFMAMVRPLKATDQLPEVWPRGATRWHACDRPIAAGNAVMVVAKTAHGLIACFSGFAQVVTP